jgi:hypothetical protein
MVFTEKDENFCNRKKFIKTGIITVAGSLALNLIPGCHEKEDKEEGQEVSPPEDLMQEHGLLNRILLIYDHCRDQLINKTPFPMAAISNAAKIVRVFVEDYFEVMVAKVADIEKQLGIYDLTRFTPHV